MLQSKSFVLIGLIKKKLKVTKTRMKNFLHAKTTSRPTRGPLRVAANALLAISTLEALSAVTHTHTHLDFPYMQVTRVKESGIRAIQHSPETDCTRACMRIRARKLHP